ncbi:flagellar protein export ATPase FliI [Ancylobacter dichloromethanicus]|uniref:Flagellum-specific ATP synthase n=1 Tax=Ancylobacter dichloromethanicus TaxID=518825 RepID=A0A9W6MXH6_9HYPH|nr:flagellar protein export ATPase FliI [Ancylobacter dichloromethanicus]MBS7556315.1 flagellar protein export ATPase FliI [Ancylobacter dichloromethanicus]GLK70078.1 flagellum-specific ATP synthase [Ancylobacter dichloromethanicus]
MNALARLEQAVQSSLDDLPFVRVSGMVHEVAPTHLTVAGLSSHLTLGACVGVEAGGRTLLCEVVRLDREGATVKPFDERAAVGIGARAFKARALSFRPHPGWKGRVIGALGQPLDGGGPLPLGDAAQPLDADPPAAMSRARVDTPVRTGVRVIDLFTPLCKGQRIGIFAGSGVGKSTLLAMLAGCQGYDTVVVALVGERGREVREFLDGPLAPNRPRAVVVVATSDESPMMRRLAPRSAFAVAEYFRDRGESVLLIMDSVTRYAHAARDVALAAGEPAVARGYAPSVFSTLPRLLERAGPGPEGSGSISAIFSVLVDGDDHNDPVADAIRGTLDGHIVLDRAIADQGRFPAVNVLRSVSRLADLVWSREERELIRRLRSLIARFEDTSDLRLMGGYQPGSDVELDQAVKIVPRIYEALSQYADAPACRDPFADLAAAIRG